MDAVIKRIRRKCRLLILSSCASRDIFGLTARDDFEIAEYFARAGFAFLNAGPVLDVEVLQRISSAFQRRIAGYDLDKSFWQALEALTFDMILVDFIDDRFDFLRVSDKGLVTLSSEYLGARGRPDRSQIISSTSEEKRRRWLSGWLSFVGELHRIGLDRRLIVNRVLWASHDIGGKPLDDPRFAALPIQSEILEWMYDQVSETLPTARWLTHSADMLRADPAHKMGAGSAPLPAALLRRSAGPSSAPCHRSACSHPDRTDRKLLTGRQQTGYRPDPIPQPC